MNSKMNPAVTLAHHRDQIELLAALAGAAARTAGEVLDTDGGEALPTEARLAIARAILDALLDGVEAVATAAPAAAAA
ncbi:MAG: hypothetical protein H6523_12930 [Mycolicibacterium sp.]|nr:hypothetical protein [Mycolicibacterium sp.]